MLRLVTAILTVASLSACATSADKIAGVHNIGTCSSADRAHLAELVKQQNQAAKSDAIGVLLIGLPIASMSGKDREAEIAILKGRCH